MNLKTVSLLSCIFCICIIITQVIYLWEYFSLIGIYEFDFISLLDRLIHILFNLCVSIFFYSFYKKLN